MCYWFGDEDRVVWCLLEVWVVCLIWVELLWVLVMIYWNWNVWVFVNYFDLFVD